MPNSTHAGLPGSYGPYGSSTANYNPTPAATAGNQTTNEDLSASQLKESNVYDSTQQVGLSCIRITYLLFYFHCLFFLSEPCH